MKRRKEMCYGCWPKIKPTMQPALEVIIRKCGGNLERVVKYILSCASIGYTCSRCSNANTGNCRLPDCAAAVARYIEERDGNA